MALSTFTIKSGDRVIDTAAEIGAATAYQFGIQSVKLNSIRGSITDEDKSDNNDILNKDINQRMAPKSVLFNKTLYFYIDFLSYALINRNIINGNTKDDIIQRTSETICGTKLYDDVNTLLRIESVFLEEVNGTRDILQHKNILGKIHYETIYDNQKTIRVRGMISNSNKDYFRYYPTKEVEVFLGIMEDSVEIPIHIPFWTNQNYNWFLIKNYRLLNTEFKNLQPFELDLICL